MPTYNTLITDDKPDVNYCQTKNYITCLNKLITFKWIRMLEWEIVRHLYYQLRIVRYSKDKKCKVKQL